MRKLFLLMLLLSPFAIVTAQKYPVTNITISLIDNPDPDIGKWASGISKLSINATTIQVNGGIDNKVQQSKISVTLKKNGISQCGSYTSFTIPASGFTSQTKTWSGPNAIALLGGSCVLPNGDYQLCVQFLDESCLSPLSQEVCRSFTIKESMMEAKAEDRFHHPEIIWPSNGTRISEADAKKPQTFSWTPVVPDPQQPVIYRVRIWQQQTGQTVTQAMAGQPFLVKDIGNQLQEVINSSIISTAKAPSSFIWTVQAFGATGEPLGDNNGTSQPASFVVAQAGCIATLKITSDSCIGPAENGMYRHRICATYTADPANTCNILFNHPTNNTTNNFGMFQSGQSNIFCSRTPGTSTANYSPLLNTLPSSLAPGASTSFCFDLLVPVSYTGVKFTAFGFCDDGSGNFNTANANDSITLKQCICDACKELGVTIRNDSLAIINGNAVISGSLSGLDPNKISKVTVELVYFNIQQTGDRECAKCAGNEQWGNFIPPVNNYLTGFANPTLNGAAFGREWTWISNIKKDCNSTGNGNGNGNGNGHGNPIKGSAECSDCPGNTSKAGKIDENAAGVPAVPAIKKNTYSLPIALPPSSSLACCGDKIMICIRYTWWDFCCHACDIVKCYQVERKPVTANPSPQK